MKIGRFSSMLTAAALAAPLALAAPATAQAEGAQGPPELAGPWERAHTLNLEGAVVSYRSLLDHVVLRDEDGYAV